jgi:hypothetical protein
MMDDLITYRCPQTGMDVHTLLHKQEKDEKARVYVALTCSACTRLHFIDKSTGKAFGQDKWPAQCRAAPSEPRQ